MFCPYCGREVDSSWDTCPTCGANLLEDSDDQAPVSQTPAPQKKPWYKTPLAKVIFGTFVVYFAAQLFYMVRMGYFSLSQEQSSPQETATEQTDEDDASLPLELTPSDCIEEHGYPSFLAFTEFDGKQVSELVLANGYEYYSETDRPVYRKNDGSLVFNAISDEGLLSQAEFEALSVGGHKEHVVYMILVKGFKSPDAVIKGMASSKGCEIGEIVLFGDEEAMTVIHGPSNAEYLVDVVDIEDGDYEIRLYSSEAIEARAFDKDKGGKFGNTPYSALDRYSSKH